MITLRDAARFLAWWRGELEGMLPAPLRRVLAARPPMLAVRIDPRDLVAATLHLADGTAQPLLGPGTPRAALAGLRGRLPPGTRLAVGLPQALVRHVSLPLAAASRLQEVLALDLDRQTPFRPEEVVFRGRIVARDRAARLLRAALCVAPRSALDQARKLADELGLSLAYAGPDPAPPWHDDLSPGATRGASGRDRALALGAAAMALAALLLPDLRAATHLRAVEAELAAARREAAALLARREAAAAATAPLDALRALGPPATTLLVGITAALPDDAVLRRLVLREGRLELLGSSAGTAELVQGLSAAGGFAQVEFRAPVVAAADGRELFHLGLAPRSEARP